MSERSLPEPIWVSRARELHELAAQLRREPIIAVDTESNSLYAYREQVCLIQFSTREEDYLVDPLALKDLSALGPVFANPKIEKVFHAAEYDLLCLKRDFDFEISNLFDTMIAARVLGRQAVGLGSLLEEEFGIHLNKRYQRANWGRRPLPVEMLNYARLDTRYLIPLRDRLVADLRGSRLMPLAQEDFRRMTVIDGSLPGENMGDADPWRISGSVYLSPQQAAVLKELCYYRDQVASRIDRPLFKVISDKTLLAIAEQGPSDLRELGTIKGMSKKQVQRHGEKILRAVERGKQSPPIYPPRRTKPSEAYIRRLERLRDWRKQTARQLGVESDVVLPRDLMEELAKRKPRTQAELDEVLKATPWRRENYGAQILDVIRGQKS